MGKKIIMSVVYILKRNDTPGIYKVGWSRYSGQNRAANYTDGNWIVHKEFSVPSYLAEPIERKAHSILKKDGHWLNPAITEGSAQEIFRCDSKAAELAVMNAIKIVAITTKEEASKLADESASYGESLDGPREENPAIPNDSERALLFGYTYGGGNFAETHLVSLSILLAWASVIPIVLQTAGILTPLLFLFVIGPTITISYAFRFSFGKVILTALGNLFYFPIAIAAGSLGSFLFLVLPLIVLFSFILQVKKK